MKSNIAVYSQNHHLRVLSGRVGQGDLSRSSCKGFFVHIWIELMTHSR